MPLNTPSSAKVVADRSVNDVFLALQEFGAKPSLRNSWLNSLIVAFANRIFDFYFALNQVALEALPDTAIDNLDRWGSIYKIRPTPGTVAGGDVAASGTAGSVIPVDSVLTRGDGFEYVTTAEVTLTAKTAIPIGLLASDGAGVATVTHIFNGNTLPLVTGTRITVTGAVESEFNVADVAITVLSATSFTYPISGTPSTPATGSPLMAFTNGLVGVDSVSFAEEANADGFAALLFESPVVGVDETSIVTQPGLLDGSDQETQEDFRTRLLERIQNPVAHFNVADIETTAKAVAGVTRVFVLEITPEVGQVTVYFMRDNDDVSAIPDGGEVAEVKTALDLIRPANTAEEDLIVLAPTAIPTNFSFASVTPNSSSMKSAITANLTQFFKEETSVGENVLEDAYRSVIFNTVDTSNGDRVESFDLTEPSGDIPISEGEVPTLGNVTI